MVSFYGFYTTFTIIITAASIVSLGFIIQKYNTKADSTCNVNQDNLNYNLYDLTIFSLIGIFISTALHTLGYCCTKEEEVSQARKFLIFLMVGVFVIQCIGSLLMIKLFGEKHECFTFYENNNLCLLISYVSLNVVYILQTLFVIIAVITKLFCTETKYKSFRNDYYA